MNIGTQFHMCASPATLHITPQYTTLLHPYNTVGSTNTRLFEFAVEVVPGPPETAFRMTKAVILLPKHMVENQTGMDIEIKQLGTSDPTNNALDVQHRCARMLGQNERYVRIYERGVFILLIPGCVQVECTECVKTCIKI